MSMLIFAKVLLIVLITMAISFSETHLSGKILREIDSSGNPYIVDTTIIIPNGRKCSIGPGCLFLFKEYTGIQVEGTLEVNGLPGKPVIFTSWNDSLYNTKSINLANPFDWNGIDISVSSLNSVFKYSCVKYSTYGIKVKTKMVSLTNCSFIGTGQYPFTISGIPQDVQNMIPYSYESPSGNSERRPQGNWIKEHKNVVQGSLLGLGAAGLISGIAFFIMLNNDANDVNSVDVGDINPRTGYPYTESQYNSAVKSYNQHLIGGVVSSAIGAVGIGTFYITIRHRVSSVDRH